MNVWTAESSPRKQIAMSIVCCVAGLALAIGFRDFRDAGGNATAGFLLGILLLVIGAVGLLVSGRQKIVIDPALRRITVEDASLLRTTTRTIPFGDVVGVSVGYLGKKSNFVQWYYLRLKLRTGRDYSLFAPGRFYAGGSDRSTVESWKRRLEEYLALGAGLPGSDPAGTSAPYVSSNRL